MKVSEVGLTRNLARFIAETWPEDIPAEMYEHAKVAWLDWFAVLMAGKEEPLVEKLVHFARLMGGFPQATILGRGMKVSACQAALINGSASHALDYDDSMADFLGHPSVILFPALTALAEWKEKSGCELLTAYLIGLKIGATIGACAGLEHYAAGWHGTSTIGRLAAAAGCARLLVLDEPHALWALGIAGTQASGLKRVFGTMTKPYHAGKAAQVGLESALLAENGFTSAEDILEGQHGFFDLLKGAVNQEALASLGKTWEADKLVQKYHASCHATHSPIEAALDVVAREGLDLNEIESLTVHASRMAIDIAGNPDPKTGLEGKFSYAYCVANALLRGNTGIQAFTDEMVRDPEVQSIMKKIAVVPDPQISALEARVEVKTRDGRVFEGQSDVLNEIPEISKKRSKVESKFMDLCAPVLGERKAVTLMSTFRSLDEVPNVRSVIRQVNLV
ncbi:MAG: MmgE/PrpD family protein [Deltaproteobacteria bacterium]|nr:MmgE/PrpD family protein [Deltaproteobacteria bacterium]MBW1923766.1 MmgE/PrpD family protein [Deltaproteobacteria bacterium]MBW1949023.1 MmgE/PrpD family protein [Deltaproteobacteria bacterium]MBW2007169.1 MmgE/PrpD family protein [Deltaproteobacteria bacterium]MBW2101402.1 MmgE/PrpD family protein [Deltaproteobacteria bacterium]